MKSTVFWLFVWTILPAMVGCTEHVPPPPAAKEEELIKPEDRLIHAIEKNNLPGVQQALATGSDPNSPGSGEQTPLQVAASNGFVEAGRALLGHQADIDLVPMVKTTGDDGKPVERRGNSALHTAVLKGQVEFVKLLIQNKADVNIRSGRELTPLDMATNSAAMLKAAEEDPQVKPEQLQLITEKLATTSAIVSLLQENGAQTTAEIEAKKLDAIKGGGIIGRLPESIRRQPVPRDSEEPKKKPPGDVKRSSATSKSTDDLLPELAPTSAP